MFNYVDISPLRCFLSFENIKIMTRHEKNSILTKWKTQKFFYSEKKECNGENKRKNRIGWKPATTRKEVLQEMELISYYSEDFFSQTFLGWKKNLN